MVSSASTRTGKKKKEKKAAGAGAPEKDEPPADDKSEAPDPPDSGKKEETDSPVVSEPEIEEDSDSESDDTSTPSVIPKKGVKTDSGKKRTVSASKKRKGKRHKGSSVVSALNLFSGFPPAPAADPIRDKAVSKALAQKATYIPKIPSEVINLFLTNPALSFVLFESLLMTCTV